MVAGRVSIGELIHWFLFKEPVPNKQTKEPRVKSESVEVKYKAEPVTEETMDTNKGTCISLIKDMLEFWTV